MMRTSLHQVADWLNQSCALRDIAIQGVSTDTRSLVPGNLFVALKGERFDGHDHLAAAMAAGAVAAVVSRANPDIDLPQIVVKDTLTALQTLGKCWRDQVNPFVIAITGSAGKTTVKQLLASMCAQVGATRATVGNLNNDIGVPLTLLSLDSSDRFAVIEMGANHVGEIARLTALVRPDVALVTMAGRAHVGEFGSIDAIVRAKGELYAGLSPEAKAVINLDSYGADAWWAHCPAHRFGFSLAGDVRARWAGEYDMDTNRLSLFEDGRPMLSELDLPLPGAHNATNLLAAIAVARAADLSLEAISNGLHEFTPPPGRMSLIRCTDRLTVINDTYNANPESMRAALDYLVRLPGRHVAVLGDMGELGDQSDELHESLIRYAQTLSLHGLFTLGEAMHKAVAVTQPDVTQMRVLSADEPETLADQLSPLLDSFEGAPVTVLLKGSRFMRMERLMDWLVPTHQESEAH
jgi:UDP-N-acetylmuramoyl-tripeptide--D-alanyl-D-alanine ligase